MRFKGRPDRIVELLGATIELDNASVDELQWIAIQLGGVVDIDESKIDIEFDESYEMMASEIDGRGREYLRHVVFPTCKNFGCRVCGITLNIHS